MFEGKQLLREISEHYGQYQEKEAEVLAISTDEIDRLRQLARGHLAEVAGGSKNGFRLLAH
jgi:peroxiredoxin